MPRHASIAVVVPNFNGASLLPACLDALAAQTRPPDEVVVVDNGSSDGSLAAIAGRDGVRVVALGRNTGFGHAANAGVANTTAELCAVLNSDARPAPDWLERLEEAPRPSDAWAWGSVLVDARDGTVESAGDSVTRRGSAFKLGRGLALDRLPAEPFEVLAPPGAAPLFRRSAFDALGGYAEHFFLYYEDVDLALRARLRGLRALLVPGARVTHLLGGTSRPDQVHYHVGRNSLWCAVRTLPDVGPRDLVDLTREQVRWSRASGQLRPYLRGRAAAVAGLPAALRQRRAIQAAATIGAADLVPDPPPALR